jgi:hypothetical protein
MAKSTKSAPAQEATPWGYYLSLPFRAITWPFYLIYYYLFRVPELPNRMMGVIRLAIFLTIAIEYKPIDMFIIELVDKYELPKWCASVPMGIISVLMLIGLFLSFMEILGLHDGKKSGYFFALDEVEATSSSGYSGIDEALEFRETILRSQHLPGKIEELKKTRFVSSEDISSAAKSPELAKAFDFMNTRMKAAHPLGKYNLLKEMFGSK